MINGIGRRYREPGTLAHAFPSTFYIPIYRNFSKIPKNQSDLLKKYNQMQNQFIKKNCTQKIHLKKNVLLTGSGGGGGVKNNLNRSLLERKIFFHGRYVN